MKAAFFSALAALFFLAGPCHGQNNDLLTTPPYMPHALKLSVGPAHISSSPGLSVQTEYSLALGRYFEFLVDIHLTHAYDGLKNESRMYDLTQPPAGYVKSVHYSQVAGGPAICVTPVKNYQHRFLLGAGAYLTHLVVTSSVMNGLGTAPSFTQSNDRNTGIAAAAVVSYEYNATERFLVGLRANGVFNEENSTALMITTGYRFE